MVRDDISVDPQEHDQFKEGVFTDDEIEQSFDIPMPLDEEIPPKVSDGIAALLEEYEIKPGLKDALSCKLKEFYPYLLLSDEEWTILTDYLGGVAVAGAKMKEEGTEHWDSPNAVSTNESGFTALPAGEKSWLSGNSINIGGRGAFWSSTPITTSSGYSYILSDANHGYSPSEIIRLEEQNRNGISIRCLKSAP